MPKGGERASSFYSGERWLEPIDLLPGQVQDYIVELNFQAKGITKDWSVGAWGEFGEVEVTLPGRVSSSFPFIEIKDQLLPTDENGNPADDIDFEDQQSEGENDFEPVENVSEDENSPISEEVEVESDN